jgi:hypothetical protein
VPTQFLSKFLCPKCGSFFVISDVQICSDQIFSGKLTCACGYSARIEEGILLVNSGSLYQSDEFNMLHYQEIPAQDQDFVFFQYINRLSEQYMAELSRSYAWVDAVVEEEKMQADVIFVPDLASHFLYKHTSRPYWKNALIIVSGFSKGMVKSIKSHLESLETDLNILFVANTIHDLPIKKESIDLWIDSISSYNFGFFHKASLHESIAPYMRAGARVVGITKYFDPGAKSLRNIRDIFTSDYPGNSLYKGFHETLKRTGYETLCEKYLGYVTNPGKYYKYVEKDEKHHFLGYYAEYTIDPHVKHNLSVNQ